MTDEARGVRAALARLRHEIAADREAMRARADEARDVLERWDREGTPDRPLLLVVAVALHAWYTGLEAALERIARDIDREVPAGEASHRDLLSQAMTDIDGVRPAVLPDSLSRDLTSLLGFRHFFRHAYGVDLDTDKLRLEVERLLRVAPEVESALDRIDGFLRAAAEQAEG